MDYSKVNQLKSGKIALLTHVGWSFVAVVVVVLKFVPPNSSIHLSDIYGASLIFWV